jgi:transcriptional regulator with XRE-family HTH domain
MHEDPVRTLAERRRILGLELRRLRGDQSQEGVAMRLRWDASKVSRIETARTRPSLEDVLDLLGLYRPDTDTRGRLISLVLGPKAIGQQPEVPSVPEESLYALVVEVRDAKRRLDAVEARIIKLLSPDFQRAARVDCRA